MSMRPWLTFPGFAALGSLALGCPADDGGTTGADTSSSESSSGDPTTAPTTSTMETTVVTTDETTAATLDTSSSTGVPTDCGNGELDDGELCDDGNNEEGDACHADCTPTFEIVWTALHDGSSSSFDAANDVWIDDAGVIYAAGYESVGANGNDAWVQQYMPDGTEGAVFSYNHEGGDDFCNALEVADDGLFLCAGGVTTMTDLDVFALRLEADLSSGALFETIDGPGMGAGANDDFDLGRGIVGTADGGFVVVGHVAVDDQGLDMFVARYAADDSQTWQATRDDAMMGDNTARAVLIGSAGEILVFGNDSVDATTGAGVVVVYDPDGNEVDDSQTFDFFVRDAVYDGDGNIVVVGSGDLGNTLTDAVVRKYDPDFTELWAATFDGSMDLDFANGVHVGADGNVYVAGTTFRTGEQANGFLQVYDADGNPLWGDEYNTMDVDLAEDFVRVATDPMGDVVVVGLATILGHQTDAFVRKYHPI